MTDATARNASRFVEMHIRYAALYITLGIALGLCLNAVINMQRADGARASPASPSTLTEQAYA